MKRTVIFLIIALMIMSFTACRDKFSDSSNRVVSPHKTTDGSSILPNGKNEDDVQPGNSADMSLTGNDAIEKICLIVGNGGKVEYYKDTYQKIIESTYPVMHVYYGDENKYPGLEKALIESSKEKREKQLLYIDENKDSALEMHDNKDENPYADEYSYESVIDANVRRADVNITSILYTEYTYRGGAHGSYYYYGDNFETKTGNKLALEDVVASKEKAAEAISEQLEKFWSDAGLNSSVDIEDVLNDENVYSWTLDYNGITFYFMPHIVANSGPGLQIVTVSNMEYPDVLKKEYQEVPSSYGVKLVEDVPFYYDVTGDGEVDEIIYSAFECGMTGDPANIYFNVNENDYHEENWFYDADATFVHTRDGKNYIYVEILGESDYRQILCYAITGVVKKIDEVPGGMRTIYHEGEDNIITCDVLTNPESFYLQRITQHLSTTSGHKEYYVGKNGVPVSDDKMFMFDEEDMHTFTLLKDLDADVFDPKSEEITGSRTLKAGETVLYCGTDGERYGYLKCYDGVMLRVDTVRAKDSYYYTIDGINIEEWFDGLFFAG